MAQFAHRELETVDVAPPAKTLAFHNDDDVRAAPAPAPTTTPAPTPAPEPVKTNPAALLPWLDLDIGLDVAKPAALPKAKEGDLVARANRGQAEQLLTTGELRTPQTAEQAMQLLIAVPEESRGKAIDQLSDRAFEALCEQVSPEQRAQFSKLLVGTTNPKRKLLLWAESHKSRARNDAAAAKGDVGHDDEETEAKLTELVSEPSEDAEEEWEEEGAAKPPARTRDQKKNLARHKQRVAAVVSTHGEIDKEQKKLLDKGKKLSLDDVDALIERKDLEYSVEKQHGVNLTSEKREYNNTKYAGGTWTKPELEQLKATLERLPDEHVHGTSSFDTINRVASPPMDLTGGLHHGKTIDMFDGAHVSGHHAGDRREGTSPEFWVEHGDAIKPFELALTHEIGHDVADNNTAAFDAFKQAGGWHAVDEKDLRADGLGDEDVGAIRRSPQTSSNGPRAQSDGAYYTRNVHDKNHEFWAQDKTATPAALEATSSENRKPESVADEQGRETWNYAKSNPAEHFADVYAKAVHVPEKLHADLVRLPQEAARDAHANLETKEEALRKLAGAKHADPARVAALEQEVAAARARVAYADKAVEQRGEQFRIMREDVFHTDKAAAQARARLQFSNVDPKKLAEFDERASRLSTPEQITALEQELRP